jgi:hypothetical protein
MGGIASAIPRVGFELPVAAGTGKRPCRGRPPDFRSENPQEPLKTFCLQEVPIFFE